jgi:ATP-dependent helicase/nuclease subunit A
MLTSKIVSSPAGSGKTQQLANRYIELLKSGVPPERILTVTFTDKAAAEMKERIFKILKEKDPALYSTLKEKSLLLRIQTIDSFCLSILRRFARKLDLQPDLEVLAAPDLLWTSSVYDTLMTIAEKERDTDDYRLIMDLIVEDKFRGWINLRQLFDNLYKSRLSIERRAKPYIKDLQELSPLIQELKSNPISQEQIPDFNFRVPASLDEVDKIKSELEQISDTFLTKNGTQRSDIKHPPMHNWYISMFNYWWFIQALSSNNRFKKIFDLFGRRFFAEYDKRKKATRQVDFSDLGLKTYEVLTEHPEWSNILYVFDEHTDHILVDEFQDTSFLQWAVITKLAEEWLSGLGAKREKGIEPTIFLVGDDKQSIYLFRNAHSEIFDHAKNYLETRLNKNQFQFEVANANYRSLESIIDFTNHVFSQLMSPPADAPAWQTRYAEFTRKRKNENPGRVEIILASMAEKMEQARTKDAEMVAQKITTLINQPVTYDTQEKPKPCRFEDIAILLRNRTHLTIYENALRKYNIPFVVVKGIGFYDTPEIGIMLSLLNFLIDSTNDFDLYVILKSPLFNLSEKEILIISSNQSDDKISLWDRIKDYAIKHNRHQELIENLTRWISQVGYQPLAEILEDILEAQQAWQIFWEQQRSVNIRKFLRTIEELENKGTHPIMIADYFENNRDKKDEAKANVNTEGRNEVKLMTIHAAKGLQFPIVFLVGLDQNLDTGGRKDSNLLINEKSEKEVWVSYEPDSYLKKLSPLFIEKKTKEQEEEKRIFYVSVTRARDALFLTGIYNPEQMEKDKITRLHWLKDFIGIKPNNDGSFSLGKQIPGLSIISDNELSKRAKSISLISVEKTKPQEINIEPIQEEPSIEWRAVTRELPYIYFKYDQATNALGELLHKIFEKISEGKLKLDRDDVAKEAKRLFLINNIVKSSRNKMLEEVLRQFDLIVNNKDILSILQMQKNSYTELPFVLKEKKVIHSGRIDRIIINEKELSIYDYKTFPITEKELPDLIKKFKVQLDIYKKAASQIFNATKTNTYLVFTAIGKIVEVS